MADWGVKGKKLPLLKISYIVGNTARNHFLDNFRKQGFVNNGLHPWKRRKDQRNTRSLLVKTGRLRQSIRVKRYNSNEAVIGSDVNYASYHNDGINGRLPQREFIGDSKELDEKVKAVIIKEIDKLFKK